jgi:hypothetical protein
VSRRWTYASEKRSSSTRDGRGMADSILRSNINFLKFIVSADNSDPRKAIEEASRYLQETVLDSAGIVSFSYHHAGLAALGRPVVTGGGVAAEIQDVVERWCHDGEAAKSALEIVTEPVVGALNTEEVIEGFARRMPEEYGRWLDATPATQAMRRIGLTKHGLMLKETDGKAASYFFCSVADRRDYATLLDWRLARIRGAVAAYDGFVRRVSAACGGR